MRCTSRWPPVIACSWTRWASSPMEPAGALAVAGLKTWAASREANGPVAAILSGANMNFDRLRFVAERAELGEAREAILGVTIPERPGAFREFCATIGP